MTCLLGFGSVLDDECHPNITHVCKGQVILYPNCQPLCLSYENAGNIKISITFPVPFSKFQEIPELTILQFI